MYIFNIFQWINKHVLKTYPLIEDYARCRNCGRNVHDFSVPDDMWFKVIGSKDGVYCYDCFCDRADKKNIVWRINLVTKNLSGER